MHVVSNQEDRGIVKMEIKILLKNTVKSLLLPFAVYLVFLIMLPQAFSSLSAMGIVIQQAIIPSVIGWGLCFILSAKIWDFSVGAELVLIGIIAADVGLQFGVFAMVIAAIILGLMFHTVTGLVYYFFQTPTIVTTIAMALIYEAIGALYKGGSGFTIPREMTYLGAPPFNLIIGLICMIIAYYIYNKTQFGYHVRAVGNGEKHASSLGISPIKTRFICFIVCGFFVGIAAILQLSYGGSMVPMQNLASMAIAFKPIMGVFIGMALSKFCNIIFGVFIGELTMSIITLGMVASGLPATVQNIIIGVFLVMFLVINNNREAMIDYRKRLRILKEETVSNI